MKGFLVATQFLTRLPIPLLDVKERDLTQSVVFFPLVGIAMGLLGVGIYLAAALIFPVPLARIVAIVALLAIYSAFHLDGLSDTVDAFYAGRDRESILRIMDDPHVGSMGVISIVAAISLKLACAFSVDERSFLFGLPVICLLGHSSMVVVIALLPCAREQSTVTPFRRASSFATIPIAVLLSVIISIVTLRLTGVLMLLIAVVVTLLLSYISMRKINGINGDGCGAVSESVEVGSWLVLVAGSRISDEWLRTLLGVSEYIWRWPQ